MKSAQDSFCSSQGRKEKPDEKGGSANGITDFGLLVKAKSPIEGSPTRWSLFSTQIAERQGTATKPYRGVSHLSPIVGSPIARTLPRSIVDVAEQLIRQDGDSENVKILVVNPLTVYREVHYPQEGVVNIMTSFSHILSRSRQFCPRIQWKGNQDQMKVMLMGVRGFTCRDHRRTCRELLSCWRWESQSP